MKKSTKNPNDMDTRISIWKKKYAEMPKDIPDQIFLKCASTDYFVKPYSEICNYIGLVKSADNPKKYFKAYYKSKQHFDKGQFYKFRNITIPTNRDGIQFTTADEYFAYCLAECDYIAYQ